MAQERVAGGFRSRNDFLPKCVKKKKTIKVSKNKKKTKKMKLCWRKKNIRNSNRKNRI